MINGIGITGISLVQPKAYAGVAAKEDYEADSFSVSILPQISTVTYTGGSPGNGVYSVTIALPDGSSAVSSTAALTSPSLTDIATAVRDALNENPDLFGVMVASNAAGVLTITFTDAYAGVSFSVSASTQSGTTATVATAQDAGSSPAAGIPVGNFLVRTTGELAADPLSVRWRLPQTGDVAGSIDGVSLRTLESSNSGGISPTALEYVGPGKMGAAMYRGDVWMVCARGTAAPGGTVYCQIIANGGVAAGSAAASADGGNSVTLTNAVWLDAAAVGELARIRVNFLG
jgi:hypothetical protein